ncbi:MULTISPECIES: hypothetical protein [unclassified Herbaspirillum]|uniref:hypothetical protein n=1 Tax=unclassified Herbaspirillum TaxID=2624150 RepID=UPI000E2FEF25|nr:MULTISPECIES: hypothetical protein [unclassified Herbaspirillum]RFB70802.1 hypothetical protein DZB54_09205 [Herbaspirillum sp. 3R-3a1]TFI08674.1 hypothetical protein E4P32_11055 [Herbaspirillum sp. 3R11]TFI15088.1 hypothetical protein E4P31_11050 [Herbaspirillum sp. 3R-11]TFI22536.1 hypothetical protein E4P30_18815 [Herbaspirillum sp. 3C11]
MLLSILGLGFWMWIHFTSGLLFQLSSEMLMLGVLRTTVVAGGGPAAAHFLCFAKESKQRKATAIRRPFGVPVGAVLKSGRETNSLRSDKFPFFIRFEHVTNGDS